MKKWVCYLVLFLVVVLVIVPWIRPGMLFTDDLRHHATRFVFLHDSVVGNHSFFEWMPYIYSGWPLFHFYHPMSYLLSLPLIVLFQPLVALKLSVALALVLGLFFMFFTVGAVWGRSVGLFAAVLYVFCPFVFECVYVAGSVPRVWAYAFAPLVVFFFIRMLCDCRMRDLLLFCVFFVLLFLCHIHFCYVVCLLLLVYCIYHGVYVGRLPWLGFVVILFLVVSFSTPWVLPLLIENHDSASATSVNTDMFGASPGLTSLESIFYREFGKQQVDGHWMNFFYIGLTPLIASLIALLVLNLKHKKFLAISYVTFLALLLAKILPFNIYKIIPFSGAIFATEYLLIPLTFTMAILTGALLAACLKKSKIITILIILIIIIDIGPAYIAYNITHQPTEQFTNPTGLIAQWKQLKPLPQDFRVYSVIGQIPFYYHNKYEVGTKWMGYRQGAFKNMRTLLDTLEKQFMNNPADMSMLQQYGYLGVKYIVSPCIQNMPLPTYGTPTEGFCTYINPYYEPLITSNLTITNQTFTPTKISFTTTGPGQVLVKSEYFEPHWKSNYKITPTTLKYMQVQIPEGTHNVEIKYTTNKDHIISWIICITGIIISIIAWKRDELI